MNKLHDLLVIGTGGLTLQCLPLILEKYKNPAFYNNNIRKNLYNYNENDYFYHGQFPVYHSDELIRVCENFIVCVSNPKDRENLINKFKKGGAKLINLVSKNFPNAISNFENGLIVLDNCLIEPDVQICNDVLINTNCSVHHGSKLNKFVTLGPNVTILGDCEIGEFTEIGAGVIIHPKVKIGENVIIGAGAVIREDIKDNKVVYTKFETIIKNR